MSDGIDELRRDLRRLRMTVWLVGVLAAGGLAAFVWSENRQPDELHVKRLVIEDSDGRTRVSIAAHDGAARMVILDEGGAERVVVTDSELAVRRGSKSIAVLGGHEGGGSLVLDAIGNDVGSVRAFAQPAGGTVEVTSQHGRVTTTAQDNNSRISMGRMGGPAFGHMTLEVAGGDTPGIRAVREGTNTKRSAVEVVVGKSITKLDIEAPLGSVFINGRDAHPEASEK